MLKRIGKALLFPHLAIMLTLAPIAAVFLVYTMTTLGTDTPLAIFSYVVAAYTLTVWCFRIPQIVVAVKTFRRENRFAIRWREDARLRVKVSLFGTLGWNLAYAALHLWLGIYHHTFWYGSLSAYYLLLAVMRFFLVRYTAKNRPPDRRRELGIYRACGWVLLLMNLALSLMIFFMVYWGRTFVHHEITTIALAAYTFASFASAITSMVGYKKYKSPVYSAAKNVSFAAACVSMLTLSATMLTTFGAGTVDDASRRLTLTFVGAAVSAVIVIMAIRMIFEASRELKNKNAEKGI